MVREGIGRRPPPLNMTMLKQFSALRKDFLSYLLSVDGFDEPFVSLRPLPGMTIYVCNHPETARLIAGKYSKFFVKSNQTRSMVGKFLGNGLVLSEHQRHRSDRQKMAKLFSRYFDLDSVAETSSVLLSKQLVHKTHIPDGEKFFTGFAFEFITHFLFRGNKLRKSEELLAAMQTFAEAISSRFKSIPLPAWVPSQQNKLEAEALNSVHAALRDLYDRCSAGTFLGELKAYCCEEYRSEEAMIAWMDHIKTLLFAGHETSSHLLAWAVYQLVCDPSSQAQIRDGLRAGQSGLLDAFMQEVLRFRPPVWVYDRSTTEQIILSGYRLPKGAKVYISPFIFHRSERYFKNADTFILDRFVQQKAEGITAYIPFGLSSRVCIGKQVALTQVRSVLSDLLLKYRLEFASEKKVSVRMNPGATLGLKDRLSVRLQPLTD